MGKARFIVNCSRVFLETRVILLPIEVGITGDEDRAIGTTDLAILVLSSFNTNTHIGKVIPRLEGEEDTIGTPRVLAATVTLGVAGRSTSLIDLSGNVVPVDFMDSGRQMGNRITVMSHSPRRRQLSIQPRREHLISNTRRAEGGELDTRGGSICLIVDEGQISSGMGGQGASQRMA
jgi:hypothetical protein